MAGYGPGAPAAPILMLEWTDSTNAEARRRAEAGETGPQWIAARHQTAGRGRRGRSWSTGEGDLAATLLTATGRPPGEAAQMSFVAALAVADLVQTYVPSERVRLKWPNDVMVDAGKIAGILIESGSRGDGRLWLAVGIGVNLAQAPEAVDRPATAIARHASPPDPQTALAVLAERFAAWERIWQDFGFEPIADAWRQRAYGIGEPCVARLGAETVQGVAEGLDDDGSLKLRLADGNLRKISAGDVFFGEA
jgi:BirA family transcriptional regulator, biotin operon repressor / biotin---[acetyl-CoA-carboxylase] ligase